MVGATLSADAFSVRVFGVDLFGVDLSMLTLCPQSCYGVLHCSFEGSGPLEIKNTLQEAGLIFPPDRHSYAEYDAIVVRGEYV